MAVEDGAVVGLCDAYASVLSGPSPPPTFQSVSASFIEMSLALKLGRDEDSDEDFLLLYVDESDDESWKDPLGESKDSIEGVRGSVSTPGLLFTVLCF